MFEKTAAVTIGGVPLSDEAARALRSLVTKELRWAERRTAMVQRIADLLRGRDAEAEATDDDSEVWTQPEGGA